MKTLKKLNLLLLILSLILNLNCSLFVFALNPRYLPIDLVYGIDTELDLLLHEKSFELDLSRTQNIRVRLKVNDLYKNIERVSSFKIAVYEIVGSERKFVSSQNLTLKRGGSSSRVLGLDAGYFASPTKNIEIDLFDTANNLINTY